ncbi:MAG: ParB/RepB/Spo0J family partition protein [Alphaproteobacteria bacterium]|nr:ParB/RepB/Spo0J family partition protein [Alphaproteobacteria bacterium]
MKKYPLGRSISNLFNDDNDDENFIPARDGLNSETHDTPIENLYPNPDQPRRNFDNVALTELTESIAYNGILQPILVRPHPFKGSAYEIIAGERRWQAAQKAGLVVVPIIVKDLSDADVIEFALVENMHRLDLNALEEAAGYKQLIDQFDYTQEKLAQVLARSRSHIANLLRLLSLPKGVQENLVSGRLSAGHARALVGLGNAEKVASHIVEHGLNVRQTEQLVQTLRDNPTQDLVSILSVPEKTKVQSNKSRSVKPQDYHIESLQQQLSEKLGLKIKIKIGSNRNSGTIVLHYRSLDDFDRIRQALEKLEDLSHTTTRAQHHK